jgi:hypothetical protein
MSTIKVDTIDSKDSTGNITFNRPIVADVSNVTGTIAEARLATLDATKLTGTIAEARLATLPAANLTGTIADARISASSVNAHVDLTAVRQDIAMLALYNAVSDNRAAYNLPFSFIDQFEDSTGLTTLTDVGRVAASGEEYVASTYTANNDTDLTLTSSNYSTYIDTRANNGVVFRKDDFDYSGGTASDEMPVGGGGGYNDTDAWLNDTSAVNLWYCETGAGTGSRSVIYVLRSGWTFKPNGSQSVKWMDGTSYMSQVRVMGVDSSFNGTQLIELQSAVPVASTQYTQTATNSTYYPAFSVTWTSTGNNNCKFNNISFAGTVRTSTSATSATGTLVSDVQTAPAATTKMSGVILYKDGVGSATTLGTHLKIYLTANLQGTSPTWTGTDWKEVVAGDFGAVTPLFSAGVKMVRIAEQTVVSGTACAMKAVWASQASGTLETQLHGWAMNY